MTKPNPFKQNPGRQACQNNLKSKSEKDLNEFEGAVSEPRASALEPGFCGVYTGCSGVGGVSSASLFWTLSRRSGFRTGATLLHGNHVASLCGGDLAVFPRGGD